MAKKIILIHGLGGATDKTWGDFPKFLQDDDEVEYEIISCGYESPMPNKYNPFTYLKIFSRAPSILNIANGVLTDIRNRCDLNNDEIILAGHSLGGIIIKKVLLLIQNKNIIHKIKKVCFFDVPHDGSGYANVGRYISFRNHHLKSLIRDSSELDDLNDQWINSGLNKSFEIMSVIAANDDIVSSSSSKSIFREHLVETINDVNHKTIVKPESKESTSYIVFKRFILSNITINRYKNSASRDLKDWISIERKHSYHYEFDENRKNDFEALVNALKLDRALVRLSGASGLGKSRLLLEAINTESISQSSILVFNAPGYEKDIKESIRSMVDDRAYGLVIVENCKVDLHNDLAREIFKTECFLKVVTVGYIHEAVDSSIEIKLSPLENETIKKILQPILIGMDSGDVERVARFAQGYPLMATLIAEQYQKEGRLIGSIESSSVVNKLIDGDGSISTEEKEMLSACSLFDVFGIGEGTTIEEAKYIAEQVAGSNQKVFDRVLHIFTKRQIINRAGRYARLVPKPLALTLASQWWDEASPERQKKLIETLPESLMHSFCIQSSYLDDQPNVQKFSDRLFGGQSPFVQAEELLTERGSKLFRAFVEVNPKSTSNALYQVLTKRTHKQLQVINGETRRNLVWGLEKLCFHADVFEKSSWCMLLLAAAENEDWSNNATGMFAQLFRINLSGTQADPKIRFRILKEAIANENFDIDMIVLKALEQSINIWGGARTIGAEYQGTKAPLEEWKPASWEEVFEVWQQAFDLMLVLLDRSEGHQERVLYIVGNSIRSFVSHSCIELLDKMIRKLIATNGCYWPVALESIKNTLKYDSMHLTKDALDALNHWLELLNPDQSGLSERLKILVINPPWDHSTNEEGRFIDLSAENAKSLAKELSSKIDELLPHLGMLLVGDQKQSYTFGYQLAYLSNDVGLLIDVSLDHLTAVEHPNSTFVQGLFRGIFDKSSVLWQEKIDQLLTMEKAIVYYPDLIRTGDIQKTHLDKLLELIKLGVLSSNVTNSLSYGSVISGVEPNVIAEFCLQLAELGGQARWSALNIIYMYCFSNKESLSQLREQIKQLVTAVPLHKEQGSTATDLHHWHDLSEKLLKQPDPQLAADLTKQLIAAAKYGLHHGDIWSYTKPLMLKMMTKYWATLWPLFGDAIIRSEGMEIYWLQQLLDREISLTGNIPSVLSVIPVESVIDWCLKNPDHGPIFVASCLNIFDTTGDTQPSALFISLLESFGHDSRVANELSANMGTRGWTGSLVPYLEVDKLILTPLLEHEHPNVRRWVKDHINYIDDQIARESRRDEESGFQFY